MKELFMIAQEQLVNEYLDENSNASFEEARNKTAEFIDDRMIDITANKINQERDRLKYDL